MKENTKNDSVCIKKVEIKFKLEWRHYDFADAVSHLIFSRQ